MVQTHKKRYALIAAIALAATLLSSPRLQSNANASDTSLPTSLEIPAGVRGDKPEAAYGAYYSPVSEPARPIQKIVLELESKAHGLSLLSKDPPVVQAEQAFLLESELLRAFHEIGEMPNSQLTTFERRSFLTSIVRSYQLVRLQSERLFENMVRTIDEKMPGPNGLQLRKDMSDGSPPLYFPNYRSDKTLAREERKKKYNQALEAFLARGDTLRDILILTPELLKSLPWYSRFEYVWLPNGDVKVTSGTAGHVILAGGKPVRAAGQIVFIKSRAATLMVLSVGSGNYKSDLVSVEDLAPTLSKKLNIPPQYVVLTKGEPMGTQMVKIYLKADGVSPDEINKKVSAVARKSDAILRQGSNIACRTVLESVRQSH